MYILYVHYVVESSYSQVSLCIYGAPVPLVLEQLTITSASERGFKSMGAHKIIITSHGHIVTFKHHLYYYYAVFMCL